MIGREKSLKIGISSCQLPLTIDELKVICIAFAELGSHAETLNHYTLYLANIALCFCNATTSSHCSDSNQQSLPCLLTKVSPFPPTLICECIL
ncbi:hypothetical protein CDAR_215131 [Caerostris darwini]|uniref:Uncharacterized protein n=1 Tax=Caerostris darwini TaxID=1538125 RepID=A0AAV4QNM0_9ARAC|nr:hypothetical protein CDAR_215131 [Caerostris darwini]